MRSDCMSMPYTSQSVVSRMRLDRWWPMKPLTPRMRTFFMEWALVLLGRQARLQLRRRDGNAIGEQARNCQQAAIAAHTDDAIIHHSQPGWQIGRRASGQSCSFDNVTLAAGVGEGARVGRRDRPVQVVDLLR